VRPEALGEVKKYNDLIGNQTRDLPVYCQPVILDSHISVLDRRPMRQ
jgi:hypothetical protein